MKNRVGAVWERNMDLGVVLAAHPSSIFTKNEDKNADTHPIDHRLLIPNPPAPFPPRHGTLPFLASWLEYFFSPLCTIANKSKRLTWV